jgi:hypothetical protein
MPPYRDTGQAYQVRHDGIDVFAAGLIIPARPGWEVKI